MKLMRIARIFIAISFLAPRALAASKSIAWEGRNLTEVKRLGLLPKPVQEALATGATGLKGIADRGGRFNVTDVVDAGLPMRRFILAGIDGNSALVAMEHGGRGYHVEVVLFAEVQGKLVVNHQWTFFQVPKNLGELIRAIETAPQSVSSRKEAESIAESYFALHVGCGAFTGISENTSAWIVEGKVGYAGKPIEGFFIDKKTGRITSPIGPSYANQNEMRKEAPK